MTYDNWERKKEIVDISAGTYSYTYNAYGETLTETTPKGVTNFTLDSAGKLISKKIVGTTNASSAGGTNDEHTNITCTYTYDPTNKWLTNLSVVNTYDGNSDYAYFYDSATKQLNKTVERLPFATFTKQLTFDSFGRVATELSKAEAHGKQTSKTVNHVYQNGVEVGVADNTSQQLLWKINAANARGQFTSGFFGNANLKKDYDQYGFPTNTQLYKSTEETQVVNGELVLVSNDVDVMVLANQFEPVTGNLTYRSNSMFNWAENLEYDSLDRLKKWTSAADELINYNFSTNNTQGFVGVNGGSVGISFGKLRVNTTAAQSGGQKLVAANAYSGSKYKLKVNVTRNSTDKVRVVAVEENNQNGSLTLTVLSNDVAGVFESDYVVQNADVKLFFRFDKSENSSDVGVAKIFFVDDLIVRKYNIETQSYDDRGKITQNNLGQYQYTNNQKPYQTRQ